MAIKETAEEEAVVSTRRTVRPRTRIWPLSALVYLYRNAGKSIPLVMVIMLAVLLETGVIALIDSIPFSIRMTYQYTQEMLGVSPRGDPTGTDRLLRDIQAHSPVPLERVMHCRVSNAQVESIVGHWPFVVLGLGQDDMRYYLRRLHTTQIEGRLPAPGAAEAIISEPVAKNLKLHIYDPSEPHKLREQSILLGPDKTDDYSPMPVKVVGIADTDQWLMINSIEYQRSNHFPPVDLGLVFAKNLKDQDKLGHWAEKHFQGKKALIFAHYMLEKQTKEMFNTLFSILDVVIFTLALVITFMMGMLMNIYQSQRLVEFGLLQAIGYTRSQMLWKVFAETAIVIFLGWMLGVAVAQGLLMVADRVLMQPHAFALQSFDQRAFNYALPLPVAILTVAAITVWWRFRRFDPVAIVERRLV